jgi:hypothetical protein
MLRRVDRPLNRLVHDRGIGEKLEEDSGKALIPQREYTGLIDMLSGYTSLLWFLLTGVPYCFK